MNNQYSPHKISKKGFALTWETTAVAIIIAIFIVIMLYVFLPKISQGGKSLTDCSTIGGQCVFDIKGYTGNPSECPTGWSVLPTKCKKNNQEFACCISTTPKSP